MTESEVATALNALAGWACAEGQIQRTYAFADFLAAMRFVNDVALAAESQQHHPDILIRWNRVTLSLSTHDAGGITERDFRLARTAESLALQQGLPAVD